MCDKAAKGLAYNAVPRGTVKLVKLLFDRPSRLSGRGVLEEGRLGQLYGSLLHLFWHVDIFNLHPLLARRRRRSIFYEGRRIRSQLFLRLEQRRAGRHIHSEARQCDQAWRQR